MHSADATCCWPGGPSGSFSTILSTTSLVVERARKLSRKAWVCSSLMRARAGSPVTSGSMISAADQVMQLCGAANTTRLDSRYSQRSGRAGGGRCSSI